MMFPFHPMAAIRRAIPLFTLIWLISVSSFVPTLMTLKSNSVCIDKGNKLGMTSSSSSNVTSVALEEQIRQGNRGDRYTSSNSTILSADEVALELGVKPIAEVPASTWKRAWNIGRRSVRAFHLLDFSSTRMVPDSSLCLQCLWWKALSGNDRSSPAFDDFLSFSLLPRGSRWITRVPSAFPRLHHGNVELRTAFLDRCVGRIRQEVPDDMKIQLITLGGGYDVRSIKLREKTLIDRSFELDLDVVVEAKSKMFRTRRFRQRVRRLGSEPDEIIPTFFRVNLNDVGRAKDAIHSILAATTNEYHTIFLFEAVMIYLDEGVPASLLEACSNALQVHGLTGSLCFADRLENIPGGDFDIAKKELESRGWEVAEWLPKPGLARHMGWARPFSGS